MKAARFWTFIGSLSFLVVFYAVASQQTVSPSEATVLAGSVPATSTAGTIWMHNLVIALLELVPVAGFMLAGFSAWSTGLTTASIAANGGMPSIVLLGDLMLTPFFWLEFSGYALSLTASVWLLKSLLNKTWQSELPKFAITVAAVVVVLGVSALVEMAYILHQ